MRFQPEHDPDPLRSKFKLVDSLDDITGDERELFERLKSKVSTMMDTQLKNHPDEDAVRSYIAFQELRITNLQAEIKNIYEMLLQMAVEIDRLQK
jgi:hypothetical protein